MPEMSLKSDADARKFRTLPKARFSANRNTVNLDQLSKVVWD